MAQKITYVGEINTTRTYILPNVHQDPRQFLTIARSTIVTIQAVCLNQRIKHSHEQRHLRDLHE
jgi:hypothetical protein